MLLGVFGGQTVTGLKKAQDHIVDIKARHAQRIAKLNEAQHAAIDSALADRAAALKVISQEMSDIEAIRKNTSVDLFP